MRVRYTMARPALVAAARDKGKAYLARMAEVEERAAARLESAA